MSSWSPGRYPDHFSDVLPQPPLKGKREGKWNSCKKLLNKKNPSETFENRYYKRYQKKR